MAQETPNLDLELDKDYFEIGVKLLLLHDPLTKDHATNDKAVQLAFEYFKASARLGNFSGKVMAACLAKSLNQSYPEFTAADIGEVVRRVCPYNNKTIEDMRNYGLCFHYGLIDNKREPINLDTMFFATAFVEGNDLLSIYHLSKSSNPKDTDVHKSAMENSVLIAFKKMLGNKNHIIDHPSLKQKITELEQRRDNFISTIEDIFTPSSEIMLCSTLPTEVTEIIQGYHHKIIVSSMHNFFASTRQPEPVSPEPEPQEVESLGMGYPS